MVATSDVPLPPGQDAKTVSGFLLPSTVHPAAVATSSQDRQPMKHLPPAARAPIND